MNERQRQDYLEAMGIQPWFPRFTLPGAKPSTLCDWDFDDSPVPAREMPQRSATPQPASVQPTPVHNPAPVTQPGAVARPSGSTPQASAEILDVLGFSLPEAATEVSAPCDDAEASGQINPVEPFRLAAIDISQDCLAITDLPWSGLNQFTGYHQRLLTNIMRALNLPCDQEWKQGLFCWPMLADGAPVDRKYAHEAVHAYLNNQFGLKRRKTVLIFGRTAGSFLWDAQQDFEEYRGVQQREGVHYGITFSLGELMNVPGLKAEAWKSLRNLGSPPTGSDQPQPLIPH